MRKIFLFACIMASSLHAQYGGGAYGSAVSTTSSTPTFAVTPATFSGLSNWYDPDSILGIVSNDTITVVWPDISGNNRDATPVGSPIWQAAQYNGHSVISFDSSGGGNIDYFTAKWDTTGSAARNGFTAYVVHTAQPVTSQAGVLGAMDATAFDGFSMSNGTGAGSASLGAYIGSNTIGPLYAPSAIFGDRTIEVFSLVYDGSTAYVYLDTTLVAQLTRDCSFNTNNIRIGTRYNNQTFGPHQGKMGDIAIYNNAHTATERNALVNQYFKVKFGY